MMLKPHELIVARRKELGLSDVDVAQKSGLTIYEYGDIEQHANEIYSTTDLRELKQLCRVLSLELLGLFNLPCAFCGGQAPPKSYSLPRSELIKKRRTELGLSQNQLAERIGFEPIAIQQMEDDEDFLEGWPIELITELAATLELPMQALLAVKCPRCER